MKLYKHYSFDLWLTLIKSNPVFKDERAKYFYNELNTGGYSLNEITTIIRDIDVMTTTINERVGKSIDALEMIAMILHQLRTPYDCNLLQRIYNDVEQLFFKYKPILLEGVISTLQALKEKGAIISLLSNTGFIKSLSLMRLLKILDISKFFSYQYYSDVVGVSKPSRKIYEILYRRITIERDVSKSDIIHIGDNPIADYEGATSFGFDAMIINSNDKTIKDVLLEEPLFAARH